MTDIDPDTDRLVDLAEAGDPKAVDRLLDRHRGRLRRMVGLRLDRRVAARVDPSDVVQDALAEAARRLGEYLARRPVPFYVWLRRIAWERLVKTHRRHAAGRRAVGREEVPPLPDESAQALADRVADPGPGPCEAAARAELRARARAALDALPPADREVLALRHLEGLSTAEAAAVLGCSEGAAKVRLLRALQRLRNLLDAGPGDAA